MEGEGIQKGDKDTRKRDADRINDIEGPALPEPEKPPPRTIEEAIRAGDWAAVARIRLATIAALERASHEDVDGDGRVAGRKAETREEIAARLEASTYLDADGRDPWGYKYYSDFGYDKEGNYRDSFGGVRDKEGVYHAEDGGTSDLKRGVSEKDGTILNHVTHQAMWLNKEDGNYYLVNVDPVTKAITFPERENGDPQGKPVAHTKAEAEAFKANALKTNPEATPEQMAKWAADDIRIDESRRDKVQAGQPKKDSPGTSQTSPTPSPTPSSTSVSGAIGGGLTTGMQRQNEVSQVSTGAGKEFHRIRAQQRHAYSGLQRAEQTVRNSSWVTDKDPGRHEVAKWRLGAAPSADIAAGTGNPDNPLLRTNIAPADNPIVPRQSVFHDDNGRLDAAGGYIDKDGGYCFKHGGYLANDGSYMDRLGNFVDNKGNLWLANNKSDKPDFPKKDGVSYVDLLRAKDEDSFASRHSREKTSYAEWTSANGAAMGDGLQALENGLKKVAEDSEVRARASSSAVYRGQGSFAQCYVDKEGNLWLEGALTPVGKREGVDYADLLKKAAQGKLDEWTATGDLTLTEIARIKNDLKEIAAAQEAVADMTKRNVDNLQGQVSEMADVAGEMKKRDAEIASKSKFAPTEQKTAETPSVPTVTSSFGIAPSPTPAGQETAADEEKKPKPVSLNRPQKAAGSAPASSLLP